MNLHLLPFTFQYISPSSLSSFSPVSPPQMRHSLIYNYLREPGVSMLQNAYKHPCSKHLITVGKGTHFFPNRDKKTDKKFGITPFFNKRFGRSGKNSYLCTTRTRQASSQCLNRRVVLCFLTVLIFGFFVSVFVSFCRLLFFYISRIQ